MDLNNRKDKYQALRKILLASALLNLVLAGFILYKKFGSRMSTDTSVAGYGEYEYKLLAANAAFYQMLPNDSNEIVFAGTSMTADFPLQEMFRSIRIKNRGIALTRTSDLLARMEEITSSQPGKVFIEAGINDIGTGITADTLLANMKKIILAIKTKSPATGIYMQSLFPSQHKEKQDAIAFCNQQLEKMCGELQVDYINLYPSFLKEGVLDPAMTFDGIQFNGNGYTKWKELLEPFVNE